ncbi:hypothetical protein BVRB_7g161140 [Beta vulgaris subsp. vulgaris]|nr:hypothetical protein BVRB_7g161140 [Beta vulgaris subsp. vulgaris]
MHLRKVGELSNVATSKSPKSVETNLDLEEVSTQQLFVDDHWANHD